MLKKVQDSVKDIKSESAALDEKIKIAMVLKFRRNTCIGLVSAVYQVISHLPGRVCLLCSAQGQKYCLR